jgi:hypothetical protein
MAFQFEPESLENEIANLETELLAYQEEINAKCDEADAFSRTIGNFPRPEELKKLEHMNLFITILGDEQTEICERQEFYKSERRNYSGEAKRFRPTPRQNVNRARRIIEGNLKRRQRHYAIVQMPVIHSMPSK